MEFLQQYSSAIVAFSGGVDSSYLAFMAHRVLGSQARAVTLISPSVSELQREMAIEFAQSYGLNHQLIHTHEMENPEYTRNSSQRCFFCKSELYEQLERLRRPGGRGAGGRRRSRPSTPPLLRIGRECPQCDAG